MNIDPKCDQEYVSKCSVCSKEVKVVTQKDDQPEYYTDVSVLCSCGNYVAFELPVN